MDYSTYGDRIPASCKLDSLYYYVGYFKCHKQRHSTMRKTIRKILEHLAELGWKTLEVSERTGKPLKVPYATGKNCRLYFNGQKIIRAKHKPYMEKEGTVFCADILSYDPKELATLADNICSKGGVAK